MKITKIYLLMKATGSWDDYSNRPVDAYTTREIAVRIAEEMNHIIQELLKEQPDSYTDEYQDYWESKGFEPYYIPTYSVQEIELIS